MRTIRTARLTLEPQLESHAPEMFQVLSDPNLYLFENAPPPSLEALCTRFAKLESRRSADGSEQWLNWVLRFGDAGLIGFVQATIFDNRRAAIAYVLASAFWGRGLASEAVAAMCDELAVHHGVERFSAVLKGANARSVRLLERLAFSPASEDALRDANIDPDEILMVREGSPCHL